MACSVQHGGKIATFLNRNQLHEMKMTEDAWIGDDFSITNHDKILLQDIYVIFSRLAQRQRFPNMGKQQIYPYGRHLQNGIN